MTVRIPPAMRRTLQLLCMTTALAISGGSALLCARALAETALILPPGGDADEGSARTLENVVLEALQGQGFTALLHRELAQTNAAVKRCVDLDCASNLPQSVRADLLVALALWKLPEGAGDEKTLVLTLRDNRGRYPVQIEVRGALPDATQQALLSAQALRLLGPGPWLALQGSPLGAEIELDGQPVGTLPLRVAIPSGPHELRVTAVGFEPHLETVHVPLKAAQMVDLHIALQAVSAEAANAPRAAASPEARTTPSAWNYAAGGVLAAGAIALAIDPIRHAIRSGDCVGDTDQDQRCSSRVYFGGRSIGLSVAAFALALGSGYFFAFQPIHFELDAAPGRATAQFRTTF